MRCLMSLPHATHAFPRLSCHLPLPSAHVLTRRFAQSSAISTNMAAPFAGSEAVTSFHECLKKSSRVMCLVGAGLSSASGLRR